MRIQKKPSTSQATGDIIKAAEGIILLDHSKIKQTSIKGNNTGCDQNKYNLCNCYSLNNNSRVFRHSRCLEKCPQYHRTTDDRKNVKESHNYSKDSRFLLQHIFCYINYLQAYFVQYNFIQYDYVAQIFELFLHQDTFLPRTTSISRIFEIKPKQCQNGSWYLPTQNRNADAEYAREHILGAIKFDIDAISLKETTLPHMLPKPKDFENAVSDMGISNEDSIVVYDGMNIFSAARVFWTFQYFGHQKIAVLDGGLPAWKKANGSISDAPPLIQKAKFRAFPQDKMLKVLSDIQKNIEKQKQGKQGDQVLDARPKARWLGETPEPRPIPSGHIPFSKSLPFNELIDQNTGLMKSNEEIQAILNNLNVDTNKKIVCSCGSGVTASVIYLALQKLGIKDVGLYDGSWSEYASEPSKVEIWTGNN